MKTFKKLVAFTLAETLIVMGVIGIVSALTLPNLNSSTGNKEKVAKVKKIYQNLTDAFGRAQAVYGPFDTWFINDNTDAAKVTRFGERLSEFMKVSKNCGKTITGCFYSGAYTLEHEGFANCGASDQYSFILSDGVAICLSGNPKYRIFVNIDGYGNGMPTRGKSAFNFDIVSGEILPQGYDITDSTLKNQCFVNGTCTNWVIQYDNMDYLKANTNGVCPNGTQLSLTQTNCK